MKTYKVKLSDGKKECVCEFTTDTEETAIAMFDGMILSMSLFFEKPSGELSDGEGVIKRVC